MGGNGRAATIPPSGVEAESRGKTRVLARGSAGPALRWPADASQREAFHQGRCQDAPPGLDRRQLSSSALKSNEFARIFPSVYTPGNFETFEGLACRGLSRL